MIHLKTTHTSHLMCSHGYIQYWKIYLYIYRERDLFSMLSLAKSPQFKNINVTTIGSSPILLSLRYMVQVPNSISDPNSTSDFFFLFPKWIRTYFNMNIIYFCLRIKNTIHWLKRQKCPQLTLFTLGVERVYRGLWLWPYFIGILLKIWSSCCYAQNVTIIQVE